MPSPLHSRTREPRKGPDRLSEPTVETSQVARRRKQPHQVQPSVPVTVPNELTDAVIPQGTEAPEQQLAKAILGGDALVRGELEARILANEPPDVIAKKLGVELAVIAAYEQWYFPARSELEHTSVIIHEYVRLPMSGEFDPKDVPLLWRHVGFTMGPLSLDDLLKGVPRSELRKRGLRAYLGPRSRLSLEAKYAVAARILPQPETPEELGLLLQLTLLQEQVKAARQAEEAAEKGSLLAAHEARLREAECRFLIQSIHTEPRRG